MAAPGPSNTIAHNNILVRRVPMQNLQQLQNAHMVRHPQVPLQPQHQSQHQYITSGTGGSVIKIVPVSSGSNPHTKTVNPNTALLISHSGRIQGVPQSKYADLLVVIEDMGRDIRPTYAGSRMATERLKRGIMHAKTLVRDCLAETERSARN